MTVDQCATCGHLDPKYFVCTRHLKNISDIESCFFADEHATPAQKTIKSVTKKAPVDREYAIALVRHMRMAVTYSTKDEEYAKGFFAGWTTACGAILSALGESPSKWVKDEDR